MCGFGHILSGNGPNLVVVLRNSDHFKRFGTDSDRLTYSLLPSG